MRESVDKPWPRWVIPCMLAWTGLVAFALWWNMAHMRHTALDLARVAARSSFEKDLQYRQWANLHGGVYVPITQDTPPNPHLTNVVEREITTPSGRRLTLMNPAYMTRQVHELAREHTGQRGHITSLKPIRAENAPDVWERRALESFERGVAEVSSVEILEGEPHLRLMRPVKADSGCLKCHAAQGYREGDIRGGISVAVPMRDYTAVVQPHQRAEMLTHSGIWITGLGLLGGAGWQIQRRRRERVQAEAALREKSEELDRYFTVGLDLFCIADLDGHFRRLNPQWEKVLGYSLADLEGRRFLELVHPDDQATTVATLRRLADQKSVLNHVNRYRCKDGSYRWIEWRSQPAGSLVYAAARDITERTRSEEALRERNHYIDSILVNAPIGFAVNTIHDGKAVFVSAKFEEIYGVPRGSLHSVEDYFEKVYLDPVFREQIRARMTTDMATGDPARMRWENLELITPTGQKRFVTAINIPLLDQNLMVSTVQDVTERMRAETQVREQLDELRRWQKVMLEQSDRSQELKREVNELARRLGEPIRYPSQATTEQHQTGDPSAG